MIIMVFWLMLDVNFGPVTYSFKSGSYKSAENIYLSLAEALKCYKVVQTYCEIQEGMDGKKTLWEMLIAPV